MQIQVCNQPLREARVHTLVWSSDTILGKKNLSFLFCNKIIKTKFPVGLTCNFQRNLRFFSYCSPRSSQFKTASGQPFSHPSTPWRQWCSSTLSVEMKHRETKWLSPGYTEIPWQRNNDLRSSGVMLWSWIIPLPSYSTLLSLKSVKPPVSAPSLLGWGWDPGAQSLRHLSFGLFSALLWKHCGRTPHGCLLSTLYGTWCREDCQGSSAMRQG